MSIDEVQVQDEYGIQGGESIHFSEIENLRTPLLEILKQIKPAIDSRRYGMLVSDDTGGRIPTIILGRTINRYYFKHGQRAVPSIFIQGSRNMKHLPDMLNAFQSRSRALSSVQPDQRALLVTEHIGQGINLKHFTTIFNSLKLPYDVAAIEASVSERKYQIEECLAQESHLFAGDSDFKAHFIDFKYTGVNPEKYTGIKFITDPEVRKYARVALQDARLVSNQLLEEIERI